MSTQSSGVCDVCGAGISAPNGYLLVTGQVVGEPRYWQHYYRQHEGEFSILGARSYAAFKKNKALREKCALGIAGQSSPWLVCESCIGLFSADRQVTRGYAEQWWQSGGVFSPPGVGRAPLAAVNMDEKSQASPPPKERQEGLVDRLMRPRRIKSMWEQAGKFGTDAQTTQSLCGELLEMVDETSKDPDVGRIYIVRGNSYLVQDRYEDALADFTRAADLFRRRKDLLGLHDAERRMRFLHTLRIPKQAPAGSEKAKRLQEAHWATSSMDVQWKYSSGSQLEKMMSFLGDPDPDVRAFAAYRLADAPLIAPEAKKWLVDYYCMNLSADEDRVAFIGRRVGDLLFMGPDEVFPADLTWMKLGKEVPRSFINCTCAHCGYPNRAIPVPPAGPVIPYFSRSDRQGAYSVPALCARCSREFYVAWDTDPRR